MSALHLCEPKKCVVRSQLCNTLYFFLPYMFPLEPVKADSLVVLYTCQ